MVEHGGELWDDRGKGNGHKGGRKAEGGRQLVPPVGGWGGLGQSPQMLLLSRQLAASVDFSPLTKTHQSAVLAHCPCFSIGVGLWHHHLGEGGGAKYAPPPPLSFPTPGKTVPHHPLGDGHQVTPPPCPPRGTALLRTFAGTEILLGGGFATTTQ